MKTILKNVLIIFIALFLFAPVFAFAHQPRITEQKETMVYDPEISKAYYSKLEGDSQMYRIDSDRSFDLYINLLVPDIKGQKRDVYAFVIKDNKMNEPLVFLDGPNFEWKKFFEPFGFDSYLMGPEYKARVEAGKYDIYVWSANNDSKYSLAIGEKEAFDLKETINAVNLIHKIKKDFFNESPASFILSPFGIGYIIIMYILAFIIGFLYRLAMKFWGKKSSQRVGKNINKRDRIIRAILGAILLILAITTIWNPIVLFLSGFLFFEAIFSWCGIYAAMGKNTCPIQ
ncbi:DUF2892 domain-containing protein [Patescibacteria group bacterium]|nr:DUF2892 domain-containing protein [Patescibacteria group bacterium]MBU1727857.1 DUF2892 domain-containing protein [Patescibacteria group bacterium]